MTRRSNNKSRKQRQTSNKKSITKPQFCLDKQRNRDNLYFLKYYFENNIHLSEKESIMNDMFDCVELKYVKHVYDKSKDTGKTLTSSSILAIDKYSNLVYKNHPEVAMYGYYTETLETKDKTKKNWKRVDIFDKNKKHKYIIYPENQEFETVVDVFDEYKEITEEETSILKNELDDEISGVIDKIKEMNEKAMDAEAARKLKYKLGKIINNLYNSNLDITEETYNTFNEFLTKYEV